MLLQVEGLNTYYGESHALRDFSLTVEEGEIVALLGRNGMGKSTALKSIMGLVRASSGRVLYRGGGLGGAPPSQGGPGGGQSLCHHVDRRADLRALPVHAGASRPEGPAPVRRRAADARHREDLDGQPGPGARGRAHGGPRPARGEGGSRGAGGR